MIIIGLTGSIATGKSTVSRMFQSMRIPVFDADAYVHQLLKQDAATFHAIERAFPSVIENNSIDRKKLGAIVFQDTKKLKQLEDILHPKVRAAEIEFIKQSQMRRCPIIVLDIPLLFETGADLLCGTVWVTYCPDFIQRQRIMRRAGMTADKCDAILAKQIPQQKKIAQADRILPTGIGKAVTMRYLKSHLQEYNHA